MTIDAKWFYALPFFGITYFNISGYFCTIHRMCICRILHIRWIYWMYIRNGLTPRAKQKWVHAENKVYFTLNPLATSSGNALGERSTANVYLGPKATTNLSTATFAPSLILTGVLDYRCNRLSG